MINAKRRARIETKRKALSITIRSFAEFLLLKIFFMACSKFKVKNILIFRLKKTSLIRHDFICNSRERLLYPNTIPVTHQ
jgi:hypothetical protein